MKKQPYAKCAEEMKKRREVSLDDATVSTLKDLGEGNLSLGVRLAADLVRSVAGVMTNNKEA